MTHLWNRVKLGFRWLALAFLLSSALTAVAQQNEDEASISSFVNSVAKSVYYLAWPSATYRSVSLNDIQRTPGGYDVLVTLDGLSGMDGSDLWVQLVLMIRNGQIEDLRVRRDNHLLFAPFEFWGSVGQALTEYQREYRAQHPDAGPTPTAPAPDVSPNGPTADVPPNTQAGQYATAACINNPTNRPITFSYRFGVSIWRDVKLDPGEGWEMWLPDGDSSQPLNIRYDEDYAPGNQERDYTLPTTKIVLPVVCSSVASYKFGIQNSKIVVFTRN